MNLIDQIDQLFANTSDEQLNALLAKGNCEYYNTVGSNFMNLEAALQLAECLRNTYQSKPVDQPPAKEGAAWSAPKQTTSVDTYEEMPMAA